MAASVEGIVREKLASLLKNTKHVGSIGCLEYGVGKTVGIYGRYHMRYPSLEPGIVSFRAQMTASRAAYILHKRRPDMIGEPGTGHVSHLCHNSRCVNIAHLHLESPATNCQRKPCQFKKKCQGSCDPVCIFQQLPMSSDSPSSNFVPRLFEPLYI